MRWLHFFMFISIIVLNGKFPKGRRSSSEAEQSLQEEEMSEAVCFNQLINYQCVSELSIITNTTNGRRGHFENKRHMKCYFAAYVTDETFRHHSDHCLFLLFLLLVCFSSVPAKIIDHLSTQDITVQENELVTLVCNVTGVPPPEVTWYRHVADQKGVEKMSEFCPGTDDRKKF